MMLPQYIIDAIRKKAPGEDPIEYIHRLVEKELDPGDRAEYYLRASEYFWEEGVKLVERGDLRQGGEKIWNSVVQLVKAVAERRGWRHDTHHLVWAAVRNIAKELRDRNILTLFAAVEQLHVNFYEGHLGEEEVKEFANAAATLREKLKPLAKAEG